MPCNWLKFANIPSFQHRFKPTSLAKCTGPPHCSSKSSFVLVNRRLAVSMAWLVTPKANSQSSSTNSVARAAPSSLFSTSLFDTYNIFSFPHQATMTPAQMSRAAAEAVRLCANDGQFTPALFVVNSLHRSTHKDASEKPDLEPLSRLDQEMEPIDFGQPVSPRLAAHCLLHALIRAGHTRRAARLSEFMMKQGIRVRTLSNESVVSALCKLQESSISSAVRIPKLRSQPRSHIDALKIVTNRISNPNTTAAVRIIQSAREFGHSRTQNMYGSIISACLMQGEIIVASLLFVLLVKDWQARQELLQQISQGAEGNSEVAIPQFLSGSVCYPSQELSSLILRNAEEAYSSDLEDPIRDVHFQDVLQALANLAMLIEQGQLHTGSLSPLIRTLSRCPKTRHQVWIVRGDTPKRVSAYRYFQRVLMRIIGSFKKQGRGPPPLQLPQLDLRTYNSLLAYTLRHRLSPALASDVLNHMCIQRDPPLEPNVVTGNIILRSGTLLRKDQISQAVLAAIGGRESFVRAYKRRASTQAEVAGSAPETGASPPSSPVHSVSDFPQALRGLKAEHLILPEAALTSFASLKADSYTLVAYLTHLVSTGNPRPVGKLLFRLIPELNIVDHPSYGNSKKLPSSDTRAVRLKRAVSYGPRFFAAVLNALVKVGQTGLAERVWILATQAQRASWVPGFVPGVKPWCLSIHAYTTMLQCYAAEASKGVPRLFRGKLPPDHQALWKPRSNHQDVRGWARYYLHRPTLARTFNRSTAGRRMGLLLFRSIISGGRDVYKALRTVDNVIANNPGLRLEPPAPDARFFNAALDLFSRKTHMVARATRGSRSRWKRRLRFSKLRFEHQGEVQRGWSPYLQEIASAMVASNHSVPIGYRHLFIGRWLAGILPRRERPPITGSPYAFPRPKAAFRPHGLATYKTRGLPLGRRQRARRRNTRM